MNFTIVIVQFPFLKYLVISYRLFYQKFQPTKHFLVGHYLLTRRRTTTDILVLLGVEPLLIDPMCARTHTLTQRNSQSPLFFNKIEKGGKRKIQTTRKRRRRCLSTVPVHRFPWLTSHNLFHVYASISIYLALCCAPSTKEFSSLPPLMVMHLSPLIFVGSGTRGSVTWSVLGGGRWKLKRARPVSTKRCSWDK
jgi:hypothetical protein